MTGRFGMLKRMLNELTRLYDAYVDTYRAPDGRLPSMMQLKRVHTAFCDQAERALGNGVL